MNVNLAPVLDVYRTAGDFEDQYERSYSKDPGRLRRSCGSAFITAQQARAWRRPPSTSPASAPRPPARTPTYGRSR